MDKQIFDIINKELDFQQNTINLIASENIVSKDVLKATGSRLNKYTEGYPEGLGRYYNGCKYYDEIENICRDRVLKLLGTEDYHANVQPHSGSQANMAVYEAVLELGDTVLSSDLSCYSHLTHGSPVNFSGKHYNFIHYGLTDDGYVDYDSMETLAKVHKPKMIIVGYSAYPRAIDFDRIRKICDEVGAYMMCDVSHVIGLIVANNFPNPCNYNADFVTFTTHKTFRSSRHAIILCKKEFSKKIDKAIFPGIQGGSLMNQIAGVSVGLYEASQPEFKKYQDNVVRCAKTMAEEFVKRGYSVVTSGTDTHLILIDLTNKGLNGRECANRLEEIGIIVNKNSIPNETLPPSKCSGIRLGTPTICSRGMGIEESKEIVDIIDKAIDKNYSNQDLLKLRVERLCERFPILR